MMRWFLFPSFLLLIGCNNNTLVSDHWKSVDNADWTSEDTVQILIESKDSVERYDLIVEVDHTTDYPYSNLYIEVGNRTPDGDTLRTPVSLELANNKGQWQGECGGTTCKATIPLRSKFYFQDQGEYAIWVLPYMRTDSIPSINNVTLRLDRAAQ